MSVDVLSRTATLIIVGNVQSINYEWDEEWGLIFTIVKVDVEKFVKGEHEYLKNEIEIMFPGGELGGRKLSVDGTPNFSVGEKVIAFLEPEIKNRYRVAGWFQGKNRIINNIVTERNIELKKFIEIIKSFIK
jgi:hypothetical protein